MSGLGLIVEALSCLLKYSNTTWQCTFTRRGIGCLLAFPVNHECAAKKTRGVINTSGSVLFKEEQLGEPIHV